MGEWGSLEQGRHWAMDLAVGVAGDREHGGGGSEWCKHSSATPQLELVHERGIDSPGSDGAQGHRWISILPTTTGAPDRQLLHWWQQSSRL